MLKTNKIVSLILAVVLVVSMFTIAFTSTAALSEGQTWVVAGSGGLCGSEWQMPPSDSNYMTYNPENGNYEILYTGIAAGNYEFKVVNGTTWGDPDYNLTGQGNGGDNGKVTVTEDGSNVLIGCDGTKAYVTVTPGAGPIDPTDPEPTDAPTPTEAPAPGETVTIYFQNNWVWPTVEMYWFDGAGGENAEFPGETLSADAIVGKDDSGAYDIYKLEVPAGIAGIVFSGEGGYGRDQSEDVTDIKAGYCYYMTWDEPTQTKPCASYPYEVEPTEPEPTDPEPTDPEPTDPEPTDPEPTDPVDPEGLFVKADGVLYEVKQGDKYTYTFYVGADKKICSLDMSVFYDTEGLDPVYPLDSYGDPDLVTMFPVFGDTVVANTDIDGEFLFNYSAAAGKGVPVGSVGVTFDFLVTAESGVYEINTVLRDLAVVGANKEMIVVRDGGVDQGIEGVTYAFDQKFDAPTEPDTTPTEPDTTPTEPDTTPTEPVDPEGLFVKADGVLYAVEQGEKYTYTFYVGAEKKICSLDMSVFYDTEGLDPVYPLDSYGDPDLATMFPVFGDTVVANTEIDGEFLFNYSAAAGKGVPEGSVGVTFDFLVTAESGIYEINTVLRDLAVVGANKEMIVVLKSGEDQNTGISYSSDAKFDAPVAPDPTEPDTTPTEPDTTPTEPDTTPTEPDTTPTEPDTTPTEPDTTPTEPEPVKTYVVADGNWYEVEVGETFVYSYLLACSEKIGSLDATTTYDVEGLTFVPSVDEYGDDVIAEMFPNVPAMVYNYDVAGQVQYNFTSVAGIRFPAGDEMTAKNLVFVGSFTVTGEEGGVYYINTNLKTLGDVNADAIVKNGEVVNPDVPFTEGVSIADKAPVPEPDTTPTEPDTTPTEPDTTPTEPDTTPTEPDTTPTEPDTTPTEPEPTEPQPTEPSEAPSEEPSEEETVPAPATSDDTSTGDGKQPSGGNGVQTGSTTAAIAFLAVLVMSAGAVMFARKRKAD